MIDLTLLGFVLEIGVILGPSLRRLGSTERLVDRLEVSVLTTNIESSAPSATRRFQVQPVFMGEDADCQFPCVSKTSIIDAAPPMGGTNRCAMINLVRTPDRIAAIQPYRLSDSEIPCCRRAVVAKRRRMLANPLVQGTMKQRGPAGVVLKEKGARRQRLSTRFGATVAELSS
jgi:hypothetical protein